MPSSVYDSHVYPRQSSNGSTVIVYGHETGLRVVWYAGRKYKSQKVPSPKANAPKDDVMVIDLSDDDEPSQPQSTAKAEFEEEQDEIDPSHPYHDILRTLDISFGAAALKLAFPHMPIDLSDTPTCPALLRDHLVVAVACADLTMRMVVFPLLPPAPDESDISAMAVQIMRLSGPGFHQDLLTAIALTYTGDLDDAAEESTQSRKWSLLIASTSCTGSGLLLVHQIPVAGSRLKAAAEDLAPIRRQHLRTSLISATLAFNTSLFPNEGHSTLLITIPVASCVKVYQIFKQQTHSRSRRGSVATTDSTSTSRSGTGLDANNGKFLITLLPDFPISNSFDPAQRRKSVVDAQWVLGGRAIIALLENGEWGVWDLEAAGPASSNSNLIKGQSNTVGIVGGSWTRFSTRGSMPSPFVTSKPEKQSSASGGLVAATPHTRKAQAQGLFYASDQTSNLNQTQGGSIRVTSLPGSHNDESVVINYGTQNLYISSILGYWKTDSWRKGILSATTSTSLLPSLRLSGECIKSISILPDFSEQEDSLFGTRKQPNFMVSTSSRLILFVHPLVDGPEDHPTSLTQTAPLSMDKNDQSLLQRGSLDVDGMDRILDTMNSPTQIKRFSQNESAFASNRSAVSAKPNFGRSVAFAQDVDMDMTPVASPQTSRQLQLSSRKGTERRLFS